MTQTNRRTFLGSAGVVACSGRIARGEPSERVRVGGDRGPGPGHRAGPRVRQEHRVRGRRPLRHRRRRVRQAASRRSRRSAARPPGPRRTSAGCSTTRRSTPIAVATPDHWHALIAVMACQAGKDVYCEKPASHNVVEGRRMVEAARKYNRVVQVGTQRRSMPHVKDAVEHVQSGELGKVGMARAWIHQKRQADRPRQARPGPRGRRLRDVARARPRPAVHEPTGSTTTGTGSGTGGPARSATTASTASTSPAGASASTPRSAVTSGGGKYVFDDDQEVPDTQIVTWEFPNACIVWEHRMWSKHGTERLRLRHRLLRRQGDADRRRQGLARRGRRRRPAASRHGRPVGTTSRTSSTASRAARSPTPTSRSAT